MGRYPKERKVFSSTENDELIPAMCVFFSLLHLINSQMVWWSWKICSERAAAWLLLQAGNKTRREVQVQGWEGHSVNVIACFKALVVCGQSYAARKKCTQVVMETLSDVAKLTFWEARKKINSELKCNRPCLDVWVVGICLSNESGYFTLMENNVSLLTVLRAVFSWQQFLKIV